MPGQPTPTIVTIPFARDATGSYINTIPNTSQIGVVGQDGVASWPTGFPPLSMTAISGGGVAPRGQDFNGVLNVLSQHIAALQAGQHYLYSSTVSTALSGYKKGALLVRSDGNGYWLNNVDGNTTDPDAGGANWTPVIGEGLYSQALTNANVTLTAPQWARDVIVLTGTLTANVNVVFPALVDRWLIVNQTTGAFSVTCKTASGSGTVVSQGGAGAPTAIWCDGTNVYPAASVAWSAITNTPTTIAGYNITALPWANVTGKPTTVTGYGITDGITTGNIASQSVAFATNAGRAHPVRSDGAAWDLNYAGQAGQPSWLMGTNDGVNMYVWNPSNFNVNNAATANNATFASNAGAAAAVPFSGITSKPTTLAGYGITNGISTSGGQAIGGALTIANGDLTVYRSGGTTGVVFLRSDGGAYIYYDGSNYQFPNGQLFANGAQVALLNSPGFTGTPTCPTAPVATSNGQIANTAFVNPSQSIGSNGYVKLASGLILQWGSVFIGDAPASPGRTTITVGFPLTFPTQCFMVVGALQDVNNGPGGPFVYQTTQSQSQAQWVYGEIASGGQSCTLRWFATGV